MSLVSWRENKYFEKRESVMKDLEGGCWHAAEAGLAEVFKHCCTLCHCYTKAVSYAGFIKVASKVDPTIYSH